MEKKAVRGATVNVKCKCCPTMFDARVADRKRGWGLFCNKSCKAFWQKYKRPRQAATGEYKKAERAFENFKLEIFLDEASITQEQYGKLKKAGVAFFRRDEEGELMFSSEQLRILGASKWEIQDAEHQEALEESESVHDW